ncbi:MAG TPA: ABC transporter permease subunit [Polyangiaceae bacterium]|jgi:ABC-type dipeptide/oligopeptide/nickel transport system permease component|nr:ABC transporter permease subunit [Polyangiaceae bacterium]
MLRHAIRRLLWTIPTLVGVSFICFLFLSFVPDITDDPVLAAALTPEELAEKRRERFLDLPRFLNFAPRDVRARATEAIAAVADGGAGAEPAARELARLGGAALPYVLPAFDALAPEPRGRVALALAPVAARMGLATIEEAQNPTRAVALWTRFWDDRGVEFRSASVRSAVRRLVRYGTLSRAAELRELDTFVLEPIFEALARPGNQADLDQARALLDVAAHVTGRDDRIAPGDSLEMAGDVVDRWKAFWNVHRSDFVTITGMNRVTAIFLETRYGKWALGAVTYGFGLNERGEPILDELGRRAPITLTLLFGAIALAYLAAVPLGVLTAASRGHKMDLTITSVVLFLYAVPPAVLAVIAAREGLAGPLRLLVATLVLALGLVAAPTRQLRSMLVSSVSQEYARAAVARGASRWRLFIVHAMRNALLPFTTLASLEPPLALGGAFVVERVFGLDGLGDAMIRAVNQRDVGWLMALSMLAAFAAALLVLLTDLLYILIDPRLEAGVTGRKVRG